MLAYLIYIFLISFSVEIFPQRTTEYEFLKKIKAKINKKYILKSYPKMPIHNKNDLILNVKNELNGHQKKNLKWLSLQNYSLYDLSVKYFQKLHLINLEILNLDNCSIIKLFPYCFWGLNKLKYLYLRNNLIDYIFESSFTGLNELEFLYLTGNPIEYIDLKLFKSLKQLKYFSWDNYLVNKKEKRAIEEELEKRNIKS